MKFMVYMKDPDTLTDAIKEAVDASINAMSGLSAREKQAIHQARADEVGEICSRWFEYGEYLGVEVDTEAKTCTVLTAKEANEYSQR